MSEGRRKWSDVSDDEVRAARREPARRVTAPATALIVVACLGVLANGLLWLGLSALRQQKGPPQRPPGMDDATYQDYERGQASAPCLDCCLVTLPTLAVYPLVLAGGIQMQRLRRHWLAVLASVLAMLPCSPVFLLGLPLGIWALVVLLNADVKATFERS